MVLRQYKLLKTCWNKRWRSEYCSSSSCSLRSVFHKQKFLRKSIRIVQCPHCMLKEIIGSWWEFTINVRSILSRHRLHRTQRIAARAGIPETVHRTRLFQTSIPIPIARVLSQSGLYLDAIRELNTCIAIDSNYISARFQFVLTYVIQKNVPEQEMSVFSWCIELNPNNFLSLFYKSEALKRFGKPDSASQYLFRLLSVNPRSLPALIRSVGGIKILCFRTENVTGNSGICRRQKYILNVPLQ